MDKIATRLTDYYISKNYIPEQKRDIYIYGFKLIIADVINFSIIILLGCLLRKLPESIMFLITLCGLRQFTGGFHAKTFWLCRLSMVITFICVMAVSSLLVKLQVILPTVIILNVVCFALVAFLAPIEHSNKELTNQQRKSNKIKSIITASVLSIIAVTLVTTISITNGVTISITLLAVVFLMLISLVIKKGGNENV